MHLLAAQRCRWQACWRRQIQMLQTRDLVFPFPSMDELYQACPSFPQSREFTAGVEEAFLNAKDVLKSVLDPLTQPLSWLLEFALFIFLAAPWWVVVPLILLFVWYVCQVCCRYNICNNFICIFGVY